MEPNNITPFEQASYIASVIYKAMEKEALTENERKDLDAWIAENDRHARAFSELQDREALEEELRALAGYDTRSAARQLFDRLGLAPVRKSGTVRTIVRWTAAAAIVVLLAASGWWWMAGHQGRGKTYSDVAPGGNKAILTLADGSRIALDTAQTGQLAVQGQTRITGQHGEVTYKTTGNTADIAYNTMTTPRGGQYKLVLPDGSNVLLNAASSLRYPTAFTGGSRTVELTGEAYFEIAKNTTQPFIVKARGTDIKVLGTAFNVMAYDDEPGVRTTLVNGAVQVTTAAGTRTLEPGQLALAENGGLTVGDADTDKETAWTTGFFKFDHTDIQYIMREVARWYDIDVVYETTMNASDTYSGRISRNLPLSELTAFLEGNGIHHFRIDGRQLTVLP